MGVTCGLRTLCLNIHTHYVSSVHCVYCNSVITVEETLVLAVDGPERPIINPTNMFIRAVLDLRHS